MSSGQIETISVEEILNCNKYEVDDGNAHIQIVSNPDMDEFAKLVRVCPAGLYKIDADGVPRFDYAGCLECGTCRIACGDTIVEKWENPKAMKGVQYRFG